MTRWLPILLLSAAAATASAQSDRAVVVVTDPAGNAIPFAFVQIENGASRVADDSGRAVFNIKSADSLKLQVRRIGFEPFIGWSMRSAETGTFLADLLPLARTLDPVAIRARRDTPLARTGFYDRVERVQRGAYSARMITPEELDMRNPLRISQIFSGERYVKVTPMAGRVVLMGRNALCAMTILLDGRRVLGTLEEAIGSTNPPPTSSLMSIDELITASSVAAIEIYGSVMSAPVELQRVAGSQGCGIIAIWTGSRR